MDKGQAAIGRREVLGTGAVLGGSALFGLAAGVYKFQIGQPIPGVPMGFDARGVKLPPTPSCGQAEVTPLVSEGPFYAPATPLRRDLRPGSGAGRELHLTGQVLDTDCRPIPNAVVDFWQTDPAGVYDHFGYDFRGHQFTDGEGRYALLTVLPASYHFLGVWRRRHIHLKIAAPGFDLLTSQVFFPFGMDSKVEDVSFDRRLVTSVTSRGAGRIEARYDFVLARA